MALARWRHVSTLWRSRANAATTACGAATVGPALGAWASRVPWAQTGPVDLRREPGASPRLVVGDGLVAMAADSQERTAQRWSYFLARLVGARVFGDQSLDVMGQGHCGLF